MSAAETRQKLIETGAYLFHRQGYNNTGLSQILTESRIPKGSFYFHFANKKQFALATIDYFNQQFSQLVNETLNNKELTPQLRFTHFHQAVLLQYKKMNYQAGCPIGNLTQEMASLDPAFQDKVSSSFGKIEEHFADLIADIEQTHQLNHSTNNLQLAQFIVNSWEGAVLRMKAEQNSYPLQNWYQHIYNLLF